MELEKRQLPTIKEPLIPLPTPGARCRSKRWRPRTIVAHCCAGLLMIGLLITFKSNNSILLGRQAKESRKEDISAPHRHRRMSVEEREKLYLSVPSTNSALEASRAYATRPHLAGSSEDLLDAKAILHLLQDELGIHKQPQLPIYSAGTPSSRNATLLLTTSDAPTHPTAWIDTYFPVLNTGVEQVLQILDKEGNVTWTADLVEDGDSGDPDAHKYRNAVPPWHGLSAGGDVSGQLIYANYGLKEDYDQLITRGVNLTGKIVITRYGGNYRGLKVKRAQELGAAGVLIFSDPRDDGFVTVKNGYAPYPAGPARNPASIQRGSVLFISSYPGDPTTPGYPSYEHAERTEGSNIPKIPSLPISWMNAQRLLEEIGTIQTQNGSIELTGKASESTVRLLNRVDNGATPIWNTMASIPGHIRNEVVIVGCHRDAWVMGAADPTSGTVSLQEIIRGFGALLRKGWKPLRTIVIASWDAEEYGLIGSTEWAEDVAPWISDHVVAYLNIDTSVAGSRWNIAASPSLAHIIRQTALDIPHPTMGGKTLWDAGEDEGPYRDTAGLNTTIDEESLTKYTTAQEELRAPKTRVPPLGSGSDFTVFLQRLGVASQDQGFGPTLSDAVYHYHSIYDTQLWQERYADPGFERHVAVAKHLGLLALRLIDAIVLPLNTTQYSLELDDYLQKVEDLLPALVGGGNNIEFSALRGSIRRLQESSLKLDKEKHEAEGDFKRLLRRMRFPGGRKERCKRRTGVVRRAADWIKLVFGVPPPTDAEIRMLTLRHADSWEDYMGLEGTDERHEETHQKGLPFPSRRFIKAAKRVAKVNQKLIAFERGFISEEGIKDREWYKHLGVAPGKWLGYGATTFPGLTEAITFEKNVTLVQYEAKRLQVLLEALATKIDPSASEP